MQLHETPPSRGAFLIGIGILLGLLFGVSVVVSFFSVMDAGYGYRSAIESEGEKIRAVVVFFGCVIAFFLAWIMTGVGYIVRYLARLAYAEPAAAERVEAAKPAPPEAAASAACCKCADVYSPSSMHKLKDGRYLCAPCREQVLANRANAAAG